MHARTASMLLLLLLLPSVMLSRSTLAGACAAAVLSQFLAAPLAASNALTC
jgi:hypothetical protein